MLSCVALGMSFGIVEVLMPAFGEAHGSRAQGGFALACFALGSLIGGLWIGTRPPARRLGDALRDLAERARARAPPAARRAVAARHVPAHADRRHADRTRPSPRPTVSSTSSACPGTTTEAFAWLTTAIVAGLAIGTSAGGAAIEHLGLTGRARAGRSRAPGVAALVAFARRASLAIPEPVP